MNIIKTSMPDIVDSLRIVDDPQKIAESFSDRMSDESRLEHTMAEMVCMPSSTDETSAAVRKAVERGLKVVVSGGRTGIVGGSVVTEPCCLICLDGIKPKPVVMSDDRTGDWCVRAGAGMTVAELSEALRTANFDGDRPDEELFYPVDPTETSAQLGGTVATNASGARTLYYGATRNWVKRIKAVLGDGSVIELSRGEVTADGLMYRLQSISGEERTVSLPDVRMPSTKCTAGYCSERGMDAVDLIAGSEGTLCIITELELRLVPRPEHNLYMCQYFTHEEDALEFIKDITLSGSYRPLAVEYMDENSIRLLRVKRDREGASSGVPPVPGGTRAVVYVEFALDEQTGFYNTASSLRDAVDRAGGSAVMNWTGIYRRDHDRMKAFRHALPETVNSIISERKKDDPSIHKVGTDMAVSLDNLGEMLSFYRSELDASDLEYVIFGHAGNGHLHVNILPADKKELDRAMKLYEAFALEAVRLDGSVSAEHGIGRMKKKFLEMQYSEAVVKQMKQVKLAFDPDERLNSGVLF